MAADGIDSKWKTVNFTFEGKSFCFQHVDETDHIYLQIKRTGDFYERELLSAVGSFLRPGDWVVDAGANIGNHSIYFAGVCGCHVIAFEPNPVAAAILKRNIELNGLSDKIEVHEVALGATRGRGHVSLPIEHNLGSAVIAASDDNSGAIKIELLSDYVGSRSIRLLKIDTEGMDGEVLIGATDVINRDCCAVAIEAATRGEYLKVAELLERYGYVSAGSHNFTPTHLFIHRRDANLRSALARLSRQASLDHIDRFDVLETLGRVRNEASKHSAEANASFEVMIHALGRLEAKLEDRMAALEDREAKLSEQISKHEAILAAADAVLRGMPNLKTQADTLLQLAVQWAETENLRDAAHMQEFALLRRDVHALRLYSEGERTLLYSSEPANHHLLDAANSINEARKTAFEWRVVPRIAGGAAAHSGITLHDNVIANDLFDDGWDGRASALGMAELEAGGNVRITSGEEKGGLATREIAFSGGLFEVQVEIGVVGHEVAGPILSIVADGKEGVGHSIMLEAGVTSYRAFAPQRTRTLSFRILAQAASPGSAFSISRLTLLRLDPEEHQRIIRAKVGEPVLASMASIPSRREMLGDAVSSLLAQCDKVRVFLNNYPDIPDFLIHPRIEVRRSQDWDDRGDAGKVFWLERDDEPGYRLIVDDDLIFPPDFAEVMCGKVAAKGNKAIYATHGVLLRQPIKNYYSTNSRAATFHFEHELLHDRRVHIGATNALCLHSRAISMRWADFKYCNSADIWLALHAQEQNLEILTPARPRNWVRENRHSAPDETIYKHSLNQTRTRFDSSMIQDAVIKQSWPLTVKGQDKPKYGILIVLHATDGLAARVEKLIAPLEDKAECVVLLAYDRSNQTIEEEVSTIRIDRETHLLDTSIQPSFISRAIDLMKKIELQALFAVESSALVAHENDKPLILGARGEFGELTYVQLTTQIHTDALGMIITADGKLPSEMLELVSQTAIPLSHKQSALGDVNIQKRTSPASQVRLSTEVKINDVFERVRVLNLDRRPDRWETVSRSLAQVGIEAERFSAVDGGAPEVVTEYERYLAIPPVVVTRDVVPVRSETDFYLNYASQMSRIAYRERDGRKAIGSRGAWGYLKSYEKILEQALSDGTESLLVFDDDVQFHKNTRTLFAQAMKELPEDWLILQLGTLQYNWASPWAQWHSPMLYRTNGSAIGSHAVGMRFDAIPFLLDHVKRFDMPYDIGALSAVTRAFPDRCFVISPNLAIQSMTDSDIGTSTFQQDNRRAEAAATYRWNLRDYL